MCIIHKEEGAVELTLGDLLRWKPGRFRLVGPTGEQEEALESEISWVVSIRATTPVLPPLRGDELVVVPDAILVELDASESVGWADLASHLRSLPISGVITDHPDAGQGIDGVVVFEALTAISPDLELELNRELTERRSSLYQLGSDLARMYSSASIGGSDLASFLQLAGQRTGIPLALLASTGRVLATSDEDLQPPGATIAGADRPRITSGERDWVRRPVSGVGLPEGVLLVAAISRDEPGDRARLLLEQAGEALGLMFDRLPPVEALSPRLEAGQILAELAAGGVLPSAARRRLERFQPGTNLDGRLRLVINLDAPGGQMQSSDLSFEHDRVTISVIDDERYEGFIACGARHISSLPFDGIGNLPGAVEPLLRAYRLRCAGHLRGDRIDLGSPGSGGTLAALVAVDAVDGTSRPLLDAFADTMLARLEAYDRAHDMQLVETLGAYLDAGATVATAAEHLGVHRNTLSYRITRIIEVSGHDLADPAVRLDLQLAVAIRRLRSI